VINIMRARRIPLSTECAVCITKTIGKVVPMLTDTWERQSELYSKAFRALSDGYANDLDVPSTIIPLMMELYSAAGANDPFNIIKQKSINAAMKDLPLIEQSINRFSDFEKFRTSLSAAIAGNIIDYAHAGDDPDLESLECVFKSVQREGFAIDNSKELWHRLKSSSGKVVILGDNAGETVFDIPFVRLIKELEWSVIFVVKGLPSMNDATKNDVIGTGIEQLAMISTTGARAYGTPKRFVSEQFLDLVADCDLIISKGQGNLETFPEIQEEFEKETYYVLRVKCSHVASILGCKKNNNVVLRQKNM